MNKVILISVDGMRPDGFLQCGNPYIHRMMAECRYTLTGRTVTPSVTLPCHMSLFLGVPPMRHGIATNTYVPQVRPVESLFQRLAAKGAISAMYYGWEPLRDVAAPSTLTYAEFIQSYSEETVDTLLTDRVLARLEASRPDFVFLYLVDTDDKGGHDNGWMSGEYLRRLSMAIDNVRRVTEAFGEEYTIIVTADHGGHDRTHGSEMDEDMTIPMFFRGPAFAPGQFEGGSILDIAPTIAEIMGIGPAPEWEGKPLLVKIPEKKP